MRLGLVSLLLLATVGRCWAFDVDGYRTGMSVAEVQRHAVAADANVVRIAIEEQIKAISSMIESLNRQIVHEFLPGRAPERTIIG